MITAMTYDFSFEHLFLIVKKALLIDITINALYIEATKSCLTHKHNIISYYFDDSLCHQIAI